MCHRGEESGRRCDPPFAKCHQFALTFIRALNGIPPSSAPQPARQKNRIEVHRRLLLGWCAAERCAHRGDMVKGQQFHSLKMRRLALIIAVLFGERPSFCLAFHVRYVH
jgi:hypothetical protein